MIDLFLAWGGFSGFGGLLQQLEDMQFFAYVLPFLLIFAFVYTILTNIKLFDNSKGAAIIIAVAIGFLSLQLNFVPAFFQVIFPKFGIGLSILLVALILVGGFLTGDDNKTFKWVFFGLGSLIFLVIVILSFSDFQLMGNYWWDQYGALVVVGVVVVTAMILIIAANRKSGVAIPR